MNLSQHFTLPEFEFSQTATRLGIDNRVPEHMVRSLRWGCENILEPIRDQFGPVIISSGYRSGPLNVAIGGSQRSQHSHGQAADIKVMSNHPLQVARWIKASEIPYDQLIYEGNWVHVSWKPESGRRQDLTAHFTDSGVNYTQGIT